jgi:hypothetical protein
MLGQPGDLVGIADGAEEVLAEEGDAAVRGDLVGKQESKFLKRKLFQSAVSWTLKKQVWKILYYFIMFIYPVLFFVSLYFPANFLSPHKIVWYSCFNMD